MSNSAFNNSLVKFPVHFVQARKGVRSRDPVAGLNGFQAFPDRDGVQPDLGDTFMCSIKFILHAKKVVFLTVHEQVDGDQKHGDKKAGNRTEGAGQQHHKSQRHDGGLKPVGTDEAIEYARAILKTQDVKHIEFGNLRLALAHKRLQSDESANNLRREISLSLAAIEALQCELQVPTKRLLEESEKTRQIAEQLVRAREERDHLKRLQAKLSTERLRELGQRGKQLKADPSNSALAAEIDELKRGFAQRQQELSAKIAANKDLLADKNGKGLEDDLFFQVCGLMWLDEGMAAKEEVVQAVKDVFDYHARITEGKKQLADLVNHFEHRLYLAGK